MLKLRLKKTGRKKQASYRIVLIESESRRDGRPIENLGFYSPHTEKFFINRERTQIRLQQGAKPTKTVKNLLSKINL